MAPLIVNVYYAPERGRSTDVAKAMEAGIKRHGGCTVRRLSWEGYRQPDADVAIFYGLLRNILNGYKAVGRKAIYIDLGYWGRHEGGRRAGYHKLALNSRHPTSYFQSRKHDASRFNHFGVPVRPWRGSSSGPVLLAGMSAKAALAEGFQPEEWERGVVQKIRRVTDRQIVYRPKPNWPGATPITGTRMLRGNPKEGDIYSFLDQCHAIVTHHSNVSVEGLLYGVPVFCWDGVATAPNKACMDLSLIENPPEPKDREQWAYDLAWTQWNIAEMVSGEAWAYLKNEGLVS